MNLSQYRLALDLISQGIARSALGLIRTFWSPGMDVGDARRSLVPVLVAEVRARRLEAYRVGVDFLRAQAAAQGVPSPYVPAAGGYPEQAVDSVLREHLRGSPQEAAQAVSAALVRHVEASARQVVVRAAEEPPAPAADPLPAVVELSREAEVVSIDGKPQPTWQQVARGTAEDHRDETAAKGWARVLTGADNCPFCVMLASRGPVYSSADDAGRIDATTKWADAQGYLNSYHDNCDCLVVPVYNKGAWPGRDQYRELEKLWGDATKGYSGRDAMNALGRELSRMEREGEPLPVEDLRAA